MPESARSQIERASSAVEHGQRQVAAGVQRGHGGEQIFCVGLLRVEEDLVARAGFEQRAVAEDGDAVGDAGDDGEVMRDEEHGEAKALAEIGEQVEDLRLHGDVERGGGLVGDQQLRPVDDGHRNDDALPLATGKLVRVVAVALRSAREGDCV